MPISPQDLALLDEKDHYKILGVARKATPQEIKSAFRKTALKWHTDVNPDDPENATKMTQRLNEAYETLSDPKKRKEYDIKIKENEKKRR